MRANTHYQTLDAVKRVGLGLAFVLYPLLSGFAFAVHPNLFSLSVGGTVQEKIAEFHHNDLLHFGHFLMLLGAPLLIAVAVHFMGLLHRRGAWAGFTGGLLAVAGAVILAADKSALCLAPSAFDTLPEAAFAALAPGIEALFAYRGYLAVLWGLALLPVGFAIQSAGLIAARALPLWQSIPMLVGSILLANPDIDLIGLIATLVLAVGFIPYGTGLIRTALGAPARTEPARSAASTPALKREESSKAVSP